MSLLDCFTALAEGFVARPLSDRPVGLSNIRATSDDDLLNQLSNPVGNGPRYLHKQGGQTALKPTMAFAHLHRPVASSYQYFSTAARTPLAI